MATERRRVMPRDVVRSASGFYGAGHYLNRRVKDRGLPRTAWVIIAAVALAGTAFAVVAYLSTGQWLAPFILFGVTWLFVVFVVQMGDMVMSQRQKD